MPKPKALPDTALALEQFAEQESSKRGPQCWACALPSDVLALIHEKRTSDPGRYTHDLLARFLRDKLGYAGATMFKVRHHFKQQHVAA